MPRRTAKHIQDSKGRARLALMTAYDFSLATWVDRAGVDAVLVGDSLGMVLHGQSTTADVTMAQMAEHAAAVARAVTDALIIGDLPKAALDGDTAHVLACARQFMAVGCGAVKLEWRENALELTQALTAADIPVMGHIGLTPQTIEDPKQFRLRGKAAADAAALLHAAQQLEGTGCFSVVVECIPTEVAAAITERVNIPTIGIGAGPHCDGQVLVLHDVLGLYPIFSPKFVKKYTNFGEQATRAVRDYCTEVRQGQFPASEHTFHMTPEELQAFRAVIGDQVSA